MRHDTLNSTEKSLLLFLETQAVDYFGKVATKHMNETDMLIAKRWLDEGYLTRWERLPAALVFGRDGKTASNPRGETHLVELSDEAWADAHAERRARHARNKEKVAKQIEEAKA